MQNMEPTFHTAKRSQSELSLISRRQQSATFLGGPLFAAFPKVYFGPFDIGLNGLLVHQDGYIITTHVGAGVAYKAR